MSRTLVKMSQVSKRQMPMVLQVVDQQIAPLLNLITKTSSTTYLSKEEQATALSVANSLKSPMRTPCLATTIAAAK